MKRPTPDSAAKKLEVEQRRREVLALRIGGASMAEIGRLLNLSKSTVHSHITKALDELAKADLQQTARFRSLNLQRLEQLLMAVWTPATSGKPDLKAVREARFLVVAMTRLLGLEAPIKIAHTDPTGEHERSPADWIQPVPPERDIHEWAAETQAMLKAREATAEAMVAELLDSARTGTPPE
jgi:AcrR family transcriptional regulator